MVLLWIVPLARLTQFAGLIVGAVALFKGPDEVRHPRTKKVMRRDYNYKIRLAFVALALLVFGGLAARHARRVMSQELMLCV